MTIDISSIDPDALYGATRDDLVKLAKNLATLEAKAGQVGPQNDDELHALIKTRWGIHIPRVAVDTQRGNCAPFDMVADVYFERVSSGLVVGGRDSGKTFNVAICHALNARFKPGYEGISAGAVSEQSKRAYAALKLLNSTWGSKVEKTTETEVESSLQSETLYKNGSLVSVLGGCFPEQARIITDQGPMRIDHICSQQRRVNVKSYNFKYQQWEWKPVIDWFISEKTDDWLSMLFDYGPQGSAHLTVTPGHEMVLPSGEKVSLCDLAVGDEVCVPGPRLSDEQWQVAIGSLLGDASIMPTGVYSIDHSIGQLDYLNWLHDAFDEFVNCRDKRTSKSTERIRLAVKRVFHELRSDWYPEGVKRIPDYVWDELDTLGLAIWIMDDGGFVRSNGSKADTGKTSGAWHISALNFNQHERDQASAYFDRMGVSGEWCPYDRSKDQYFWRTTAHGAIALQSIITDYIDISVKQKKGYKQWIADRIVEHSTEELLTARIKKIWKSNRRPSLRYDITVADNHNYCAYSGILVGNTVSQLNGPHSNLLHRDEIELFRRDAFTEANNITRTGKTTDGRPIKAIDLLTSSLKYAKGLLQELLGQVDTALENGTEPPYKVYKWGVAETIAPVSNCRHLPENEGKPQDELCPCANYVNGMWDDGTPRSLEVVCGGRFARGDGYRPLVPDVTSKFMTNNRSTWEAQQECIRPAADGLILENFSKKVHGIIGWQPDPEYGRIYNSSDLGGTNAHASNWYQWTNVDVHDVMSSTGELITVPADSLVCFDEVYITEIGNLAFIEMIKAREESWKQLYPFFSISERYADIAAKAVRLDFLAQGMPTLWRITREIEEHIKLCVGLIDNKKFFVDVDSCEMFCEEAEAWQRDPNTGKQIDSFNHCMSEFRYCTANIHRRHQIEKRRGVAGDAGASSKSDNNKRKSTLDIMHVPETGPSSRDIHDDPFGIPLHQGAGNGLGEFW